KGKDVAAFVGTPLVIGVRADARPGAPAGPMVTKVQPLQFVKMETSAGTMVMAFYYDKAPNTADNFLNLSAGGYYDGLTFHRVVKDFVIQGGDPRGDGSGGPGYQIDEEFNDRQHFPGVLSMARSRDFNSAGSQFFVCLDYSRTRHLDKQYTAFGKVVTGFEAAQKVAASPLGENDKPVTPQTITKATVVDVTADNNPYPALVKELAAK
ncbi:MAG TPA: peptidylprolyl isomerase, partial [Humisphaera sp.]